MRQDSAHDPTGDGARFPRRGREARLRHSARARDRRRRVPQHPDPAGIWAARSERHARDAAVDLPGLRGRHPPRSGARRHRDERAHRPLPAKRQVGRAPRRRRVRRTRRQGRHLARLLRPRNHHEAARSACRLSMSLTIDLNADLGEGYGAWQLGDDLAMLDIVTSANVACGFHAGDPLTIERTVGAAAERGVRVGAQVSYPDLVGFGRRRMDIASEALTADVLYQIGALAAFCRAGGTRLCYVKPHGALYNRIVDDEQQAQAVCHAITRYADGLPLLTLPGSVAADVAERAGLPVVHEGFADRAYTPEGRLVPRSEPGAVLTDTESVARHAVQLAQSGTVQSICVHGDTPNAAQL